MNKMSVKGKLTACCPASRENTLKTRADFHHFSNAAPSNISGKTERWLNVTTEKNYIL